MASIFDAFTVWLASQGPKLLMGDRVALLLGTDRDYPLTRAVLRGRKLTDLVTSGKEIQSKVKWNIERGYGPLAPGSAVGWQRRGSVDFLTSQWCREFGSLEFNEYEVITQANGVWNPTDMAQTFEQVLDNYLQDFYVDRTQFIEDSLAAIPTNDMETGNGNVARSLLSVINEMQAGHNAAGKAGMYPDVANGAGVIQGKDLSTQGQKGRAQVFSYTGLGKTAGTLATEHLFKALARAMKKTAFRAVPDAEPFTEDAVTGPREILSDLEGCLLLTDVLAAHDNVIAEQSDTSLYTMTTRFSGVEIMDVPAWDDVAMYPRYNGSGVAQTTTNATLVAWNDATNGIYGPRFFGPNWKYITMQWLRDKFMHESEVYALKETRPDVMVKYTENLRNLHFRAFDRHFVVRPGADLNT